MFKTGTFPLSKKAVLAPELIPDLFRVEKEENGEIPAPIDMDTDPKGDNDNGGNTGEEDGFSSEKN